MRRIFLILLIFLLSSGVCLAENSGPIYLIPLQGTINAEQFAFIDKSLHEAELANAELAIFQIDTLGGLVNSALKIKDRMMNTDLETATFVKGRAWSAGALLALAGQELYMAPSSSIGAAETRPNEEKYISALRKEFRATAEARGKNGELAAAMVDKDIAVEGISASGKLLTLTATEALNQGIADDLIKDYQQLLIAKNLRDKEVVEIERSTLEEFARFISSPVISGLLLLLGFIGLTMELVMPGFGVGGILAVLSFSLFFGGSMFTGAASWSLILLFVLGILLLGLEVLVIPGFGIAGISGLLAIFFSLFFFFPTSEIAFTVLATVAVLTVISAFLLIKKFGSSPFWQKISLGNSAEGYQSHSNQEKLLGKTGEVVTPLRPSGIAIIEEKRIDVVSEGNFLNRGTKVKVVNVSGSRIVVRALEKGAD